MMMKMKVLKYTIVACVLLLLIGWPLLRSQLSLHSSDAMYTYSDEQYHIPITVHAPSSLNSIRMYSYLASYGAPIDVDIAERPDDWSPVNKSNICWPDDNFMVVNLHVPRSTDGFLRCRGFDDPVDTSLTWCTLSDVMFHRLNNLNVATNIQSKFIKGDKLARSIQSSQKNHWSHHMRLISRPSKLPLSDVTTFVVHSLNLCDELGACPRIYELLMIALAPQFMRVSSTTRTRLIIADGKSKLSPRAMKRLQSMFNEVYVGREWFKKSPERTKFLVLAPDDKFISRLVKLRSACLQPLPLLMSYRASTDIHISVYNSVYIILPETVTNRAELQKRISEGKYDVQDFSSS